MTNSVALVNAPKAANGLTLPLSKSLGSQELAQHRAMIAVELEVLAKKMDRFGWERDRGSHAHDRLIIDWMDALQDYPLSEVKAACREAVLARPNAMPNEGHILEKIMEARARLIRANRKPEPDAPPRVMPTKEQANAIMESYGFKPKKFGSAN